MNPLNSFFALGGQVLVLFFFVALGFLGKIRRFFTEEGDRFLSDIIYYYTMPALSLVSTNIPITPEVFASALGVLLLSLAWTVFPLSLGSLCTRYLNLPPKRRDAFLFALAFGNVAYLGFPVASLLWGKLGVFYAAIFTLGQNLLLWTLGIWLTERHGGSSRMEWKQILNINVLAISLGFLLSILGISFPPLVAEALKSLGQATVPLALMLVGSNLGGQNPKLLVPSCPLIWLTFLKLLLLPLLIWIAVLHFPLEPLAKGVAVMEVAMPTAAIGPAIAQKYGGDHEFLSQGVLVTTLFSLFTIPLWAGLILAK